MIDPNKIRSLSVLEDMKETLEIFLIHPEIPDLYINKYGWGIEDYEEDKQLVNELLKKVIRRHKSLSKYLKAKVKQPDLKQSETQATTETPGAQ